MKLGLKIVHGNKGNGGVGITLWLICDMDVTGGGQQTSPEVKDSFGNEAARGIEPLHSGFADRCLPTWLRCQNKE